VALEAPSDEERISAPVKCPAVQSRSIVVSTRAAGRDVDIWLPTLEGVYKTKFVGSGKQKERRPFWSTDTRPGA
jgi:hypothetical protein